MNSRADEAKAATMCVTEPVEGDEDTSRKAAVKPHVTE